MEDGPGLGRSRATVISLRVLVRRSSQDLDTDSDSEDNKDLHDDHRHASDCRLVTRPGAHRESWREQGHPVGRWESCGWVTFHLIFIDFWARNYGFENSNAMAGLELAELRAEITELNAKHSREMAELRAEITELNAKHSREMAEKDLKHSREMAELRAEIIELNAKHSREMAEKDLKHSREITELHAKHSREMAELRAVIEVQGRQIADLRGVDAEAMHLQASNEGYCLSIGKRDKEIQTLDATNEQQQEDIGLLLHRCQYCERLLRDQRQESDAEHKRFSEALLAENRKLKSEIKDLKQELEDQKARIADLEAQNEKLTAGRPSLAKAAGATAKTLPKGVAAPRPVKVVPTKAIPAFAGVICLTGKPRPRVVVSGQLIQQPNQIRFLSRPSQQTPIFLPAGPAASRHSKQTWKPIVVLRK